MLLKIAVKNDRTEDSTVRFEPISVFDVRLLFLTWIDTSLNMKPEFPVLPFAIVATKNILAEPDCQSGAKKEVSDDE